MASVRVLESKRGQYGERVKQHQRPTQARLTHQHPTPEVTSNLPHRRLDRSEGEARSAKFVADSEDGRFATHSDLSNAERQSQRAAYLANLAGQGIRTRTQHDVRSRAGR
jgi:hypothetical protein